MPSLIILLIFLKAIRKFIDLKFEIKFTSSKILAKSKLKPIQAPFGLRSMFTRLHLPLSFFSFSFFQLFQWVLCCSRDPQTSFVKKNFIKNGSHNTIHIFKNYFIIMFSVFSKISGIQTHTKWASWKIGKRSTKQIELAGEAFQWEELKSYLQNFDFGCCWLIDFGWWWWVCNNGGMWWWVCINSGLWWGGNELVGVTVGIHLYGWFF